MEKCEEFAKHCNPVVCKAMWPHWSRVEVWGGRSSELFCTDHSSHSPFNCTTQQDEEVEESEMKEWSWVWEKKGVEESVFIVLLLFLTTLPYFILAKIKFIFSMSNQPCPWQCMLSALLDLSWPTNLIVLSPFCLLSRGSKSGWMEFWQSTKVKPLQIHLHESVCTDMHTHMHVPTVRAFLI